VYVLVLSALQATGAALGLLNVASSSIILNPYSIPIALLRIAQSAHRLEFVIVLTIFIAAVSLTAVWFERKLGVLAKMRVLDKIRP